MSIEKKEINSNDLNQKKLLEELAKDIASKFWIEKQKAESLVKKETLSWIDSLKAELNEQENLDSKEVEKLFFTLRWALELIENSSKIEIKSLKEDVEKQVNIEEFKTKVEEYLPAELVEKAKNPKTAHEHILGFSLWTANSIYTTVEALYKIWKWIIQTPFHLYMIINWKAKTDSFKNI